MQNKKLLILISILGIAAVVAITTNIFDQEQENQIADIQPSIVPTATTPPTKATNIPTVELTPTPSTLTGTYSKSVEYRAPRGVVEVLDVELELIDDEIVAYDFDFSKGHQDSDSLHHQQDFENTVEELIVGKDINDINLSRVGGASLTTEAFNQAIEQIKES